MTHFDINKIRDACAELIPKYAHLNSDFTFYYDETNNIRKFYVRENDFNSAFQSNFVLGGLVYDKSQPDIKTLFSSLNLDRSIKDAKFKHIAKGDFLSCLRSRKLNCFLRYLLESDIYVHYSTVNLLYFSTVDIVDSAYESSGVAKQLGYEYVPGLKNSLYKLMKLEIESIIKLFYRFQYPNLKEESVRPFINALLCLFKKYDNSSFDWAILRVLLKESKKNKSLPFLINEEDYVLLEGFSHFYLRPVYIFKNSTHIFDKEDTIEGVLSKFDLYDGDKRLESYCFEDSKNNLFIQASDIFVGLVGKLSTFINSNSHADIESSIQNLNAFQLESLDIYLELLKKSHNKNIAFLHSVDSIEELSKLALIHQMRSR